MHNDPPEDPNRSFTFGDLLFLIVGAFLMFLIVIALVGPRID